MGGENMLPIVNEAITATQQFLKVAKNVLDAVPDLQDEQVRCEQAILDIEHYIEFSKLGRTEAAKLSRQIKQYRLQRREIKYTLRALEYLEPFLFKNENFQRDLQSVLDKTKNGIKKIEEDKHYNPRVLYELFGQTPPQTAVSLAMSKAKGGV
jgi:hypothetical protein